MAQLALKGGTPVRTSPYPSWPVWDEKELDALLSFDDYQQLCQEEQEL